MKRSYIKRGTSQLKCSPFKRSKKKKSKLKRVSLTPVSKLRTKADNMMQDINRKEGGKCEACGGENQVLHHYHTKQSSSFLRYDWRNGIKLCHGCHFKHHISCDPAIVNAINRGRGMEWVEMLEKVRRTPIRANRAYYEGIIKGFEERLANLQK